MFTFDERLTGWLLDSAVRVAILLLFGLALMGVVRQPAKRQRIGERTLVGCLLLAALSALSPLRPISLGLFDSGEPESMAVEASPMAAVQGVPPTAATAPAQGVRAPSPEPMPSASGVSGTSFVPASEPSAQPEAAEVFSWRLLVGGLYLLGVAGGLIWLGLGQWGLYRIARRAQRPDASEGAIWEELAGATASRVRLLVSSHAGRPITFGLLRPVIVIPEHFCDPASRARLRMVLRHELAHVVRRDALTWLLAAAVQVLFFYQPLYWWLRRQLRLCQEYVADAWAAEAAGSPADYADHLFTLLTEPLPPVPRAAGAMGVLEHRSEFYRRIAMLTQAHQPIAKRCTLRWSIATGMAALAVAAVLSAVTLLAAISSQAIQPVPNAIAQERSPKPEPTAEPQAGEPEDGPVPTERFVHLIEELGGDPTDKALLAGMQVQFGVQGLLRFAEIETMLRDKAFAGRLRAYYEKEVGEQPGVAELILLSGAERDLGVLDSSIGTHVLDSMPSTFRARGVPSVPVSGTVLDAQTGNPVAGAFVYPLPGLALAGVFTKGDGSFEMQARAGYPVGVWVDAEGYARKGFRARDPGPVQQLTIALERGELVQGSVESEQGGPVAHARVRLLPNVAEAPGISQAVWTDAAGRFRFEHAIPSQVRMVMVNHSRYQPQMVQLSDPAQLILIRMSAGMEVTGVVTADGRAVAGAAVEAVPIAAADDPMRRIKAGQAMLWKAARIRTDAHGRFTLGSLEPGPLSVQVDAHGFAPLRKRVVAQSEPQKIEFQLAPGRRVTGTIFAPDGTPAGSAVIGAVHWGEQTEEDLSGRQASAQYIRRYAACDSKGRFVLENMPSETFTVSAGTADPRQVGSVTVEGNVNEIKIHLKDAPLPRQPMP